MPLSTRQRMFEPLDESELVSIVQLKVAEKERSEKDLAEVVVQRFALHNEILEQLNLQGMPAEAGA